LKMFILDRIIDDFQQQGMYNEEKVYHSREV
jgi:hypothetical protein